MVYKVLILFSILKRVDRLTVSPIIGEAMVRDMESSDLSKLLRVNI